MHGDDLIATIAGGFTAAMRSSVEWSCYPVKVALAVAVALAQLGSAGTTSYSERSGARASSVREPTADMLDR